MRFFLCLTSLLALLPGIVVAQHSVTTGTSGNWFDPANSGHGLQIEILDNSQALIVWYVYDETGQPMWLFGQGLIQGDTIRADLDRREGALFPPLFDPDDIEVERWGEIVFTQTGCDEATLDYQPVVAGFTAGNLELARLSRIDGQACQPLDGHDRKTSFSLANSSADFQPLFLDYPDGEEEFFELDSGFEPLPGPWSQRGGLRLTGSNRSDDLLMLWMRPLDGLEPETSYELTFEAQILSNEPDGCFGIGGSPGDSVYIKLGASTEQPEVVLEDSGLAGVPPTRRASIDLGQQSQPGEFALLAGNLANGQSPDLCGDPDRPWIRKRLSTRDQTYRATTDANGRLWVYVLSDSAFEGLTTWYLTELSVSLTRVDPTD